MSPGSRVAPGRETVSAFGGIWNRGFGPTAAMLFPCTNTAQSECVVPVSESNTRAGRSNVVFVMAGRSAEGPFVSARASPDPGASGSRKADGRAHHRKSGRDEIFHGFIGGENPHCRKPCQVIQPAAQYSHRFAKKRQRNLRSVGPAVNRMTYDYASRQ